MKILILKKLYFKLNSYYEKKTKNIFKCKRREKTYLAVIYTDLLTTNFILIVVCIIEFDLFTLLWKKITEEDCQYNKNCILVLRFGNIHKVKRSKKRKGQLTANWCRSCVILMYKSQLTLELFLYMCKLSKYILHSQVRCPLFLTEFNCNS